MTRSADSGTTSSLAISTESRSTRISSRPLSQYVEVGSGFSTRLPRRAIDDSAASTKLFSIDPSPRADIDRLCDEIHRVSLQEVSRDVFDAFRAGDILVVDATHMAHMNSDVVVLFTEVFPPLAPGELIGMDDVFVPWDYPAEWTSRWYSEQYLLPLARPDLASRVPQVVGDE
jgi:Methyltransferase domain